MISGKSVSPGRDPLHKFCDLLYGKRTLSLHHNLTIQSRVVYTDQASQGVPQLFRAFRPLFSNFQRSPAPCKADAMQPQRSGPTGLQVAAKKGLPPLDPRALEKYKEQALLKARQFKEQTGVSVKEGLQQARRTAADIAQSRNPKEAGSKVWRLLHKATNSWQAKALSRLLICTYFVNLVYDSYTRWAFMQQPDIKQRASKWPEHYAPVSFPFFNVVVLLPCALLAAAGVKVLLTASVLVLYEAYDSAQLIWTQLTMLLLYGYRPNELMVKRLAMVGCTALVLANSVKESKAANSYAGLLVSSDKQPSRKKSLVLLLGRLLMCALFVYVGIVQIQRVIARDFVLFAHIPHSALWARDGHDNNFLLLEFLLAIPFAVGYKTGVFGRLLALTMAMEGVTCWPFWVSWPTWSYAAHVRLHFVTNLAVAGGLLLLANFGAGRYTVDALLEKKKT